MTIKNTLIITCLLLISLPGWSQKIDSLKSLLSGKTGTERVDILYDLSYAYIDINNKLAESYGLEGYQIAVKINDSTRQTKMGRVLASAIRRQGGLDSAIQIYEIILPIARIKKLDEDVRLILNAMGMSYALKAQYDKALEAHFESLNLREKSKDSAAINTSLNNIGFVYYKLKDYDKGLSYFLQALHLKEKIGDNWDLDNVLINIGTAYAYKNDAVQAEYFIERGLKACNTNCSAFIRIGANFARGVIYFKANKLDIAEIFFSRRLRDSLAKRRLTSSIR